VGLIDKILSIFGGGSSAGGPTPPSESEETDESAPEPERGAEAEETEVEGEEAEETEVEGEEAEEEEAEDEDGGGMSTKSVAEMADPRRREGEENTVTNRAENPTDHAEAEEEEAEEEEAEDEDGGGMSTKAVAEMADPRRRDGEENTVTNRAENPDDQRAT